MLIYNLLLLLPFILSIPISLIILSKEEFKRRYAIKLPEVKNPIWFHCASLGELNAIIPLIKKLNESLPEKKILITTTSLTGYEKAKTITEFATLLPIDFYPLVKRFLKKIEPQVLITVETEFWPNLFYQMEKILIINARISDKTFTKYYLILKIFKKLFNNIYFVCAQSEDDKNKFKKLGVENVENFGNLKFALNLKKIDRNIKRKELGFLDKDFIIVWGSSRPNEEKLIYDLYPKLKERIKNFQLIIVPRHLNRLKEIEKIIKNYSLFSQGMKQNKQKILLVDKMGILPMFYAISDISIIGGSFFDYGGHNPLEAIYYKIPTIIGNYHSSCKDTVKILKKENGIVISSKEKLFDTIITLYKNSELREKLGENGFKSIKKNSQSLIKTLNCIKKVII